MTSPSSPSGRATFAEGDRVIVVDGFPFRDGSPGVVIEVWDFPERISVAYKVQVGEETSIFWPKELERAPDDD